MKTPSSLLLVPFLLAAQAARAEIKAGERCDWEFLTKAAAAPTSPPLADPRIGEAWTTLNGEQVKRRVLTAGDAALCDAGTWRPLLAGDPKAWKNPAAKKVWDENGIRQHAALLQLVGDFHKDVEAKAAAVFEAADAAIKAGVDLGIATQADATEAQAAWLKANAGGRWAVKPKLTKVAPVASNVSPVTVGPNLRKLLTNNGMINGGGDEVKKFRLAVLSLASAVDAQARTSAYATRRLGATSGLKDHVAGAPGGFTPPKVEEQTALDDVKYGEVLESLVGKGPVAIDAPDARDKAALDNVDLGLRNLLAVRAAEVQALVVAARPKLGNKTILEIETAARAAGTAGTRAANNPLAAEVMSKLSAEPDYVRLDSLFENKKDLPGWKDSPEGKQVIAARDEMQAAALSASVVTAADGTKKIVYGAGERKYALDGFDPGKVESDAGARSEAASMIAQMILGEQRGNPKYAALTAAIGGAGTPGQPANGNLTLEEASLSRDLPLAPVTVNAIGPQSCKSPKDLFRNDYERYANRQNEKAADMAAGNVRNREDVRKWKERRLAEAKISCEAAKAKANEVKSDFFADPAIAQTEKARQQAAAEEGCRTELATIAQEETAKYKALETAEIGARDPAGVRGRADAILTESFASQIRQKIDALRKDYTTAGNRRLRKLNELTGNSPNLVAVTGKWFNETFGPADSSKDEDIAKLDGEVKTCAGALGLTPVAKKIDYHSPDDADNVDKYCKVNERLSAYVLAQKGQVIKPGK